MALSGVAAAVPAGNAAAGCAELLAATENKAAIATIAVDRRSVVTSIAEPPSSIDVDNHRSMITEAGAAPGLEGADLDAGASNHQRRQEHLVDVIGRPVLGTVAP